MLYFFGQNSRPSVPQTSASDEYWGVGDVQACAFSLPVHRENKSRMQRHQFVRNC